MEEVGDIPRVEPPLQALKADLWIEPRNSVGRHIRFFPPDILYSEQNLPLQIVEAYLVVIDDPKPPNTGGGEILNGGGSDSACTDDRYRRRKQPALTVPANLLQDDMAGVTVKLTVRNLTNG